MKYVINIDWFFLWEITKDIIIPKTGRLIFNTLLFLFLGILLSIIYTVFLSKKGRFKRKPKYYNWIVKLYIPFLIIFISFVFGQIGFVRGCYKILNSETKPIVATIYQETLSLTFESEESKNKFIKQIQSTATEVNNGSQNLIEVLKIASVNYNSGYTIIDNSKNKIASYLTEKYGNDIYKVSLYGLLNLAGAKAHANIDEALPYSEFSAAMDFLFTVDYKDIEIAIQEKLIEWFRSFLASQYHSMIKSFSILLLIIISIPLIEFFIYKKWVEPKF